MLAIPEGMNMVWIGVVIGIIVLVGVYLCRSKLPFAIPCLSSVMGAPQAEKATSMEGLINKEAARLKKDDDLSSSSDDD